MNKNLIKDTFTLYFNLHDQAIQSCRLSLRVMFFENSLRILMLMRI